MSFFNLSGTLKVERYIPNKQAYACTISSNNEFYYVTLPVQLISNLDIEEVSYEEYPIKKDNLGLLYHLTFEQVLSHNWKDRNQEVWRVERFLKQEFGYSKKSCKNALFVNLSYDKDTNNNKYLYMYCSYLYIKNKTNVTYKDPQTLELKDGSGPIKIEKKLSPRYNHYVKMIVDNVQLSYTITWSCQVISKNSTESVLSYGDFFFKISKLPY